MKLNNVAFAVAGILSGMALTGEFVFFGASGFPGAGFSDPAIALPYLQSGGNLLHIAVLFGATGVALSIIFYLGLGILLQQRSQIRGLATLYFGIIGNAGDGLVALTFLMGIPIFTQLATRDPNTASNSWAAFAAITSGFGGFGNLFLGLSLFIAGWAIVSHRALPLGVGIVGLLCGITTLATVFGVQATYFPSLILVVIFRIWSGIAMLRLESTIAMSRAV